MRISLSYSWRLDGEIYSLDFQELEVAFRTYSKVVELGARYVNMFCFPAGVLAEDVELNRKLTRELDR